MCVVVRIGSARAGARACSSGAPGRGGEVRAGNELGFVAGRADLGEEIGGAQLRPGFAEFEARFVGGEIDGGAYSGQLGLRTVYWTLSLKTA
ncbi:hypothetical protein [Actinotignum timonense]|uniref:hypothetical protein n=1 Tax=Actinotignum timonense TaxID=1870995 RepID=UPI002A831E44|nr:hypothetical protein [Actinotignum timonense]